MQRFLLSILAALLVLGLVPAAAQSPAATPAATADPFALPGTHLILRIRAGNGFDYMRLDTGELAYANHHPISDGVSTVPVSDWLADWYTTIRILDMHTTQAVMVPEGAAGPIAVEVRLLSFPDDDAAAVAIPAAFGSLLRQEGEVPAGAQAITIDGHSVIAVTGLDPSQGVHSGERGESDVPFTRLIARHGAMVITVKVSSADPAFNDAVAREMLAAQVACIDANAPCVPVPLPAGIEFTPGTPMATANRGG